MKHDRDYWRSQSNTRLIEAVLTDGNTDGELCIALAEALDACEGHDDRITQLEAEIEDMKGGL
jgi:hypothetical protein